MAGVFCPVNDPFQPIAMQSYTVVLSLLPALKTYIHNCKGLSRCSMLLLRFVHVGHVARCCFAEKSVNYRSLSYDLSKIECFSLSKKFPYLFVLSQSLLL